ncbi:MAG: hypothetical protein IME98_04320 [Proteobacteria bacterium]|nr:hypothetical protein [Pseudomonadota bacterium]
MAFSTIAASDVDSDSPITDTLMNTIRTNFDDHEVRLTATEQGKQWMLLDHECTATIAEINKYETVETFEVYIPADANTLEYVMRIASASGGWTHTARLTVPSADGSGLVTTSSTYEIQNLTTPGTLDVSAESGWITLTLESKVNNTRDYFVNRVIVRLT